MAEVPETPLQYPVVLDLRGRLAVVVGPGAAAGRKARTLVRHGADVVVIAPDPTAELLQAEADGALTLERRRYERGDLEGASLVVCVSDSSEECATIASEAASRGCLAHIKGAPDLSSYTVPSTLRRGALQIAISTGGVAPAVARRLRAQLAEEFGEEWATYLALIADVRRLAEEHDPGSSGDIVEAIADSDVLARLRAGESLEPDAIYAEFGPGDEQERAQQDPESEPGATARGGAGSSSTVEE